MKKYSLTPEHEAQMKPWADKWIANAFSTKPMDDKEKEICIKQNEKIFHVRHGLTIIFRSDHFLGQTFV